jgi:hypothetical protein
MEKGGLCDSLLRKLSSPPCSNFPSVSMDAHRVNTDFADIPGTVFFCYEMLSLVPETLRCVFFFSVMGSCVLMQR